MYIEHIEMDIAACLLHEFDAFQLPISCHSLTNWPKLVAFPGFPWPLFLVMKTGAQNQRPIGHNAHLSEQL